MNYFELFDIPVTLQVDKALLRQKYLALSRQYHPDHNPHGDADLVLEAAARLNRAYKVLGEEDLRIGYLLEQKGLLQANEKYTLPPDFLMEMMELNETLEKGGRTGEVMAEVAAVEARIHEPVASIIATYKDGVTPDTDLALLKEYYFKKKYLRRLTGQTEQKL